LIVFDQDVPGSLDLYFPFPTLLFLLFFGLKNCPTPSRVAHPSDREIVFKKVLQDMQYSRL